MATQMDFAANAHREAHEETGLSFDKVPYDVDFGLIRIGAAVLIFRRCYLADDAQAVAKGILQDVAADAEPEIEGPVIFEGATSPRARCGTSQFCLTGTLADKER